MSPASIYKTVVDLLLTLQCSVKSQIDPYIYKSNCKLIYQFETTVDFEGKKSLMFHLWKLGDPDKI